MSAARRRFQPEQKRVLNETRGEVLAARAQVASSWWGRGKGLIGVRALDDHSGLIIEPCSSIHTWFMRFPIDVLFVTADGRIVKAARSVRPWRAGPVALGARYVVELPDGTLARTGTVVGDRVTVEALATP